MSSKTLLSAPPGVNGTSRLKRLFLGRKRPRSTQVDTSAEPLQEAEEDRLGDRGEKKKIPWLPCMKPISAESRRR